MRYHLEITSRYNGISIKHCHVLWCDDYVGALKHAHALAMDRLNVDDEVIDIWIIKDEDWCANKWSEGQHFTLENMKMRFRMYQNVVQG